MPEFRGTTICAVKKDGKTAIAGDGQVTMGESVVFKSNAVKVRRIFGGKVILGFAGSVADAFSLSERFEGMLNKFSGNLMRSAVELAEMWRNDKMVRKLEAMMIVADKDLLLIISGNGEVIEPDGGVWRRQLRARGRPRAAAGDGRLRRRHRLQGAQDRQRHLRVHQRPHRGRRGVSAAYKGRCKHEIITQTDRKRVG